MKSKYALAAALVLLIIAFAGISTVSATAYECYLEGYQKQNDVIVWHFDTVVPGSYSFNGKTIDTMTATYYLWTSDSTPPVAYPVTPTQTHYSTKGVDLIFKDLSVFPVDNNPTKSERRVVGILTNGDTFIASGPGFTYRPH